MRVAKQIVAATSTQPNAGPRVTDLEDGRVLEITDRNGRTARIDLRRPCPDGELLTSPLKMWICERIRESIRRAMDSVNAAGSRVETVVAKSTAQMLWAYWLLDRGTTGGDPITPELLECFLRESAHGLDKLLKARAKIWRALKLLEKTKGRVAVMHAKTTEIFAAARIPFALNPQLPGALLAIKQYQAGAIALPKWKGPARRLSADTLYARGKAILDLYPHIQGDELESIGLEDALYAGKNAGEEGRATKAIPHELGMRLLDQAALWVTKVIPAIIQLRKDLLVGESVNPDATDSDVYTERRRILAHVNEQLVGTLPAPLVFKRAQGSGLLVSSVIRVLAPTAACIAIGGTTGRRKGELESLRVGACEGDEKNGYWMRTYIEKTLQREDFTPCSRLAVEAVSQLEALTEEWRKKTGSEMLLQIPFQDAAGSSNFNFYANLKQFAKMVGATKYTIGGRTVEWSFSPHQLRKLFAVMYVWRYDAGDIYALSYHLRHFNVRMTLKYCLDPELSREIAAQVATLTKTKLRDYARGSVKQAGVYGKRLQKMIQRFVGAIQLVTEMDLDKKLTRLIKEKKIALKATPWGYCGCTSTPSNLRRAACQKPDCTSRGTDYDGTPDPTASDEVRCAGCLFFATDSTRADRWNDAGNDARVVVDDPDSSRLQVVRFQRRLQVLTSVQHVIRRANP